MEPGLILDIAVIVILAGFAIFGAVRGFAKMTVGFVAVIGAVLLAWFLHPVVAGWFTGWGLQEFFVKTIEQNLDVTTIASQLENGELLAGAGIKLPQAIVDWVTANNTPEAFAALGVATFAEYLLVYFSQLAVKAVAFLAVFIVALIVLSVVLGLIKKLNKIAAFGFLDKVLGLVLGAAFGAVLVWGLMLLAMVLGLSGKYDVVSQALETSVVGGWMYNHNLLISLINVFQAK